MNTVFLIMSFLVHMIFKFHEEHEWICVEVGQRNNASPRSRKIGVSKLLWLLLCFKLPFSLSRFDSSALYNYSEQNTVSTQACIYTATTVLISGLNRIGADWTSVTKSQTQCFLRV